MRHVTSSHAAPGDSPVARARATMIGFVVLGAGTGAVFTALAAMWTAPVFLLPAVPSLGVAWMLHAAFVASPRLGDALTEADGTLTIALRRDFPAATAAACLSMAVTFAVLALLSDPPALQVFLAVFAAVTLLPVPALVVAAVRGGRLTITSSELEYSGWSYAGSLRLDDVIGSRLQLAGQRLILTIELESGAAPVRWRSRKVLLSLEDRPDPGRVCMSANALPEPWKVSALIAATAQHPAEHRAHYHRTVVVPWVADWSSPPGSPGAGSV